MEPITIDEFNNIEIRVGTIISVKDNKGARHPAYAIKVDLGEEIGIKTTSAQITKLYSVDDLIGKQVVCWVNTTPIHISSVKSEIRILGTDSEQGVVLLAPIENVKNGDRIF